MSDLLHSAPWPYSDSAAPEAVAGEKDACGVGFLAQLQGKASHWVLQQALRGLGCMEHRGGCGGDGDSGDDTPDFDLIYDVAWSLDSDGIGNSAFGTDPVGVVATSFIETPGNNVDRIDVINVSFKRRETSVLCVHCTRTGR